MPVQKPQRSDILFKNPALLIVSAAVLWGLIGPFSVWAVRTGIHPIEVAFWRAALASLPFAFLVLRSTMRFTPRDLAGPAAFGAAGIAVMYAAFFISVERSGAGVAAVLLYTGPAWVAVFQWSSERRWPPTRSLLALLLTIAGVVMLSYRSNALGAVSASGIFFGLLSGLSFATHFIIAPRFISRYGAPFVYAVAMAAAALVLLPLATPTLPQPEAWIPLAFLALIATFVASLLFARGVVQVAPVRAAITATVEPVVATIASIVVLGSRLYPLQLAGAALVLIGVTLIMVSKQPAATLTSAQLSNRYD